MASYKKSNAGELLDDLVKLDEFYVGKEMRGEVKTQYMTRFLKTDIFDGIRSIVGEFETLVKDVNNFDKFDKPKKLSLDHARVFATFADMLKESDLYWNGIDINQVGAYLGFISKYEQPNSDKDVDDNTLSFVHSLLKTAVIKSLKSAESILKVRNVINRLIFDISRDFMMYDSKMAILKQILYAEYLKPLIDKHIGDGSEELYLSVDGEKGRLISIDPIYTQEKTPSGEYSVALSFGVLEATEGTEPAEDIRHFHINNIDEFRPVVEVTE